jgi:DNA repair protein RecO (recombination protein O)
MPSYNTEVISLKLQPVRETGGLAVFLTREKGRIVALCQGIRKMRSSLAAAAEPGTYSFASLAEGKKWDILTQVEVKDYFPEIRAELPRLSVALYLLDLLSGCTVAGQREDDLFDSALEALRALKAHPDPLAIVIAFELHLLEVHGTPLILDRCVHCGSELPGDEWMISIDGGGRVCRRCRERAKLVARVSAGAGDCLLAMREGSIGSPPKTDFGVEREIRGFLSRFVEYHLGQNFKSREFMNAVLLSGNKGKRLS